jgi:hypothetical protein
MTGQAPQSPHGLCGSCAEARRIVSSSGSRFILCKLSVNDASYPRYPRLPVIDCAGYRRGGVAAQPDSDAKA